MMMKVIASILLVALVAQQATANLKLPPVRDEAIKSFVVELQEQSEEATSLRRLEVNEVPLVDDNVKHNSCSVPVPEIPKDWADMESSCISAMRSQIQREIKASFQYMAMGAHFARDTINRPGFSEHFFKAAKEEREHGSKLIEYLSMRGELTDSVSDLITIPTVSVKSWDGTSALTEALELEMFVTKSIRKLIKTCEGETKSQENDYHLVDYLTGVYLEEQLQGQRDLAGKLVTLSKMKDSHGALGEFLFDKTLL